MTAATASSRRAPTLLLAAREQLPRPLSRRYQELGLRRYATPAAKPAAVAEPDGINGPLSTLPPPLDLPERGDQAAVKHLWRIGRAYGKFYWAGVKATWHNHKLAKDLKKKLYLANVDRGSSKMPRPLLGTVDFYINSSGMQSLPRSDFQLLLREQADFRKLPPFALMVALFGEWLPLIVPFVPGLVPRTCRIPSQIEGMRKSLEERRRASFREGLKTPQVPEDLDMRQASHLERGKRAMPRMYRAMVLAEHVGTKLDKAHALHISRSLGLGGRLWDRVGIRHPLLAVRTMNRLAYLAIDDDLLLSDWVMSHLVLSEEELRIACEERGIDVVGRKEKDLKEDLAKWLEGRKRDKGSGQEILNMLFTRPNTWN